MKWRIRIAGALALGLLLSLALGPGQAQEAAPHTGLPTAVEASVASKFSYQGRLTEAGQPVTGRRNMTFRFYSNAACTSQVGGDVTLPNVEVADGLFSVELAVDQAWFNGQSLWLGLTVGGTAIACHEILPVPYALGLKPGANVVQNNPWGHTLRLENGSSGSSTAGQRTALEAGTSDGTAVAGLAFSGRGVVGESRSGVGVFAWTSSGTAVRAFGGAGIALDAAGSGVIQSSASSYVTAPAGGAVLGGWVTGATLRPLTYGMLDVRATTAGAGKLVIFSVPLPAVLYGQPVTVEEVSVYYRTSHITNRITHTWVYRQKASEVTAHVLVDDATVRNSTNYGSYSLQPTAHNVLSAGEGFVSVVLELEFGSTAHPVYLGGVRLKLGHK